MGVKLSIRGGLNGCDCNQRTVSKPTSLGCDYPTIKLELELEHAACVRAPGLQRAEWGQQRAQQLTGPSMNTRHVNKSSPTSSTSAKGSGFARRYLSSFAIR